MARLSGWLADGLIEECGERPDPALDDECRRYYRLTSFGVRLLQAEALRLEQLVRVAQSKHIPRRCQLMATSSLPRLSRAERLYQALLWLYSRQFRRIYDQEMARTFRDCYHAELQVGGAAVMRFWGLLLSDLIISASVEHYKASMTFLKTLSGVEQEFLMANTPLQLDVALHTDIGTRASNEDSMTSLKS